LGRIYDNDNEGLTSAPTIGDLADDDNLIKGNGGNNNKGL
jgi:hypothetical protein